MHRYWNVAAVWYGTGMIDRHCCKIVLSEGPRSEMVLDGVDMTWACVCVEAFTHVSDAVDRWAFRYFLSLYMFCLNVVVLNCVGGRITWSKLSVIEGSTELWEAHYQTRMLIWDSRVQILQWAVIITMMISHGHWENYSLQSFEKHSPTPLRQKLDDHLSWLNLILT